jgi:arsenite-transporting ATPase
VPLAAEATEIDTGLCGQQVDAQGAFEASWREVQHYLRGLLEQGGVDPLEAEELTVLPGADEVLALLELRAQADSGRWDVIVVDCAPTGETLRLLALPDALRWWLRRVYPDDRRMLRAVRPVLIQLAGLPLPPEDVFAATERLSARLAAVRDLLVDPAVSSVRMVLTPEAVVVAEARRTLTSLSLYGYRVDGVVANRVFPAGGADEWRAGWVAAQQRQLSEVAAGFPGLPVWQATYAEREPVGLSDLLDLATATYAGSDPLAIVSAPEPVEVERLSSDEYVLAIGLPHARRPDVHLARKADDLVVTVGGHRRAIALPSVLRRCTVDGAALRDGQLRVRFRADPDQWMRR